MNDPISNILQNILSDYISNNVIISCCDGGLKFSFNISEYYVEIYYEIIDSFYKIKIEDWKFGSLQNVWFPTKSKIYKKTIKKMLRTQKMQRKKLENHLFCFALIIKNCLIEQGNLNSFEVVYKSDEKFDGIFLH